MHCTNIGRDFRKAMTLTEALVASLIFSIVVLGTMMTRYYSSREVFRAKSTMNAQGLALVLLETWKGMGGTDQYDPVNDVGTVAWEPAEGPSSPTGMNRLGSYVTSEPSGRYFATLSYFNQTDTNPVLLHVSVGRMPTGQPWNADTAQSQINFSSYFTSLGTE